MKTNVSISLNQKSQKAMPKPGKPVPKPGFPKLPENPPPLTIPEEPVIPFIWDGTTNITRSTATSQVITSEVQVSNSIQNGPIPYVHGRTKVTGQLMRKPAVLGNRFLYVPYFLFRVPPGMSYSFSNFRVDKTPVSEGATIGQTGVQWITRFVVQDGSMTQEINYDFAKAFPDFNQRLRTFAYIEAVFDFQYMAAASQVPVVSVIAESPSILDWYGNPRPLTNLPTCVWWFLTLSSTRRRAMAPSKLDSADFESAANESDIDVDGEPLWSGHGQLVGASAEEIITPLLTGFWGSLSWNWGEKVKLAILKKNKPIATEISELFFDKRERFKVRRIQDSETFSFVEVGYTETENYTIDTIQYRMPEIPSQNLTSTQVQLAFITSAKTAYRWGSLFVKRSMLTQLFGEGGLHPSKAVLLEMLTRVEMTNARGWVGTKDWVVDTIQPRKKTGLSYVKFSESNEDVYSVAYGLEDTPPSGAGLPEIINPANPDDPEALSIKHEYILSDLLEEPVAGRNAAAWTLTNTTVTSNVETAPDGTITVDEIECTTGPTGSAFDPNLWPKTQVGYESGSLQQSTCWLKKTNTDNILMLDPAAPIGALGNLVRARDFIRLVPVKGWSSWGGHFPPDRGGPLVQLNLGESIRVWSAGYRPNSSSAHSHVLKISWDQPDAPWLISGMMCQYRMADAYNGPTIYDWEDWGSLIPVENGFLTIGSDKDNMIPWFPDEDTSLSTYARLYDWRVVAVGTNGSKIETQDPTSVSARVVSTESPILNSSDSDKAALIPNATLVTNDDASAQTYKAILDFYTKWEKLLLTWSGTPYTPINPAVLIMGQNTELSTSGSVALLLAGNQGNSQLFFGDTDNERIGRILYSHISESMQFFVNNSQKMRITSSGDIGIGTTIPAAKLDINGGLVVSDTATFKGDIISEKKSISISSNTIDCSDGNYFAVTGSTTVQTISGGYAGKRIILRTASTANSWTVASTETTPASTNILLSKGLMEFDAYICSLELIYDGSTWFEVGREQEAVWDDIPATLFSKGLGSSTPASATYINDGLGSVGLQYENSFFENNKNQHLWHRSDLTHKWKEGTDFKFHLHVACMLTETISRTLHFHGECLVQSIDETAIASSSFSNTFSIGIPTIRKHLFLDFATFSGSGKGTGSIIMWRISRDGNLDSFGGDVFLMASSVHCRQNKLGTVGY
jgi:hypothetical protein